MRSKPETFAAYADECDRKALGVTDRGLKKLFRDLAFQWRELAYIGRSLKAEKREHERFFKGGLHIPKPVGPNRDNA
jgi:hypothetical protein